MWILWLWISFIIFRERKGNHNLPSIQPNNLSLLSSKQNYDGSYIEKNVIWNQIFNISWLSSLCNLWVKQSWRCKDISHPEPPLAHNLVKKPRRYKTVADLELYLSSYFNKRTKMGILTLVLGRSDFYKAIKSCKKISYHINE